MTMIKVGFIALVTTSLAVPAANAQTLELPRGRQGYWVSVGMNEVVSAIREKGKDKGIYTSQGLSIRLGEMVTERLGLGLFFDYGGLVDQKKNNGEFTKDDKGGTGGIGLEGSLCVWRTLALRTGFGFGVVMLTDNATEEKSLRGGAGSYLMLGASYEFFPWRRRVTGGWAISPALDVRVMPDGNVKAYTGLLGVSVTWWSGLERNMLILPEE